MLWNGLPQFLQIDVIILFTNLQAGHFWNLFIFFEESIFLIQDNYMYHCYFFGNLFYYYRMVQYK